MSEAASVLRVSEKTLGQLAREGKVPSQRVGREWRFLRWALGQWLTGQEAAGSTSETAQEQPASPAPSAIRASADGQTINGCRDTAFTQNRGEALHRWVPWIAGFSASFVEGVFDSALHGPPREVTVLDPFAGVGTTLVEGLKRGYNVVGFEINPYAALACRAKLLVYDYNVGLLKGRIAAFSEFMARAARDQNMLPLSEPPAGFVSRTPFFSPVVERKVLFVLDFIAGEQEAWLADLFRVALGAQMVAFSNYTYEPSLGSRRAAGKPDIDEADVAGMIAGKLSEMAEDILSVQEQLGAYDYRPQARLFDESCLNQRCDLDRTVDLVVTSPPYLNNYHYLRNTRPQLHWLNLVDSNGTQRHLEETSFGKYWQTVRNGPPVELGFDYPELAEAIETLRRVNVDRGAYGGPGWANYAATYFNDCLLFCQSIGRMMKPEGLMVVVIGNNILQGLEFPTDVHFAKIAEKAGFETINLHVVRRKRTGSSIINSSARVGTVAKRVQLYETAVELRWRGL